LCMSKKIDYTASAQRFYARFPVLTYVLIQINFWVFANILLGIIVHLQTLSISETFKLPGISKLSAVIIIAIVSGIVYGTILGLTGYFFDNRILRRLSFGKIILFKTIISLCVVVVLVALTRFVFLDWLISASLYGKNLRLTPTSWKYFFYILLTYYFFMTLVINFINQVNKKYGPGILIPLLLGKYRNPHEEERIFLFMDLQSSTSIAERVGHLKYSSFIRDSFMDINQVLLPFQAEVYQYVGDEIVLTWRAEVGLKNFSCVKFFFACKKQFTDRTEYYEKNYGFLPYFKAGLHIGKVTAVEIGEIKRDIAYHGDTLNTAARIQSVCNEYNQEFLVSTYLLQRIGPNHNFKTQELGMIQLRGKTIKVGIASVERAGEDR
jgi:adenylate cyclase